MTTTDTDALRERLAETLHYGQGHDDWGVANDDERGEALALADEILPIVAEEVCKAKAEALREAADSVHDNAASPYCLPCLRDDADLLHTIATEYETGDSDEHR